MKKIEIAAFDQAYEENNFKGMDQDLLFEYSWSKYRGLEKINLSLACTYSANKIARIAKCMRTYGIKEFTIGSWDKRYLKDNDTIAAIAYFEKKGFHNAGTRKVTEIVDPKKGTTRTYTVIVMKDETEQAA